MRIVSFLTDYAMADRIINHPKLRFVAKRPPPACMVSQEFLLDSDVSAAYLSLFFFDREREVRLIFDILELSGDFPDRSSASLSYELPPKTGQVV